MAKFKTPELTLKLIEENKRSKNPMLDLSNKGLGHLPNELLECKWLKKLVLSGNSDLSDLSILKALDNLVHLDASKTKVKELAFLGQLVNLQYLNLSDTYVADLVGISGLINLKYLNVSETIIEELDSVNNLINLESLYINDTLIRDIFPLRTLRELRELDVSGNKQIENLSDLANLVNLEIVNLSETQLKDLSPFAKISKLQTLNVPFTQIIDLSPLRNLSQLYQLDFAGTFVSDLSPLKNCKKLHHLNMASTNIGDLLPLDGLFYLQSLSIASTKINNLSPLRNLQYLQKLNISQTLVYDISPIDETSTLQELDISETQVKDLSPIFFFIEKVVKYNPENKYSLNYYGCPLIIPSTEIIKQGIKAVLSYFYELRKEGKKESLEAKILLIGESETGKTSLCTRLLKGEDAQLPGTADRTKGLKVMIEPWTTKLPNGEQLRLNLFDFGGQTHYKPLHQFFYSQRSLYVLVTRNGDESNQFDFWFETAQLFGYGSPVLVVNNLFGDVPSGFNLGRYTRFNSIIKDSVDVNLLTCEGLPDVKENLERWVDKLPSVHITIPNTWANVRREIEQLRSKHIISVEAFLAICAKAENGKMDEHAAKSCLAYLHDIGVCLYYGHIDRMREYVILEHEWATKAVYRVLEDKEIINRKGHFDTRDLKRIWQLNAHDDPSGDNFPYEKYMFELLEQMRYFKLCYPIHLNGKEFIAPIMLPSIRESDAPNWVNENNLEIQIEYNFMPLGLFSRFIAGNYKRLDGNSDYKYVWRDEAFFKWKSAKANVRHLYRDGKNVISFQLQGGILEECKLLLAILKEIIGELHQETPGIVVKEKVPCICPKCIEVENLERHYFELSILENFQRKGNEDIQCYESQEMVKVGELLGNIHPISNILKNKNQIRKKRPLKAFVSYSKNDSSFLAQFRKHLTALQRSKQIVLWDDTKIRPGAEWDNAIKDELNNADIIFLMISADFLATDYIWDVEIPNAIKRHEEGEVIVVPIIVRDCVWDGLPISKYQGLPRKHKVIANTPHPDELWKEVVLEVGELIEEFWKV